MASSHTRSRIDVVQRVAAMRELSEGWRRTGQTIGLVPTMGALHDGHLSLVQRARAETNRVVVSISVNPLQFGPSEDFARYPRQPEHDLELLHSEHVDLVYMPAVEEMYPEGATTRVRVHELDELLEGAHRPGHFEGVATVVTKLFNASRPHRAYFGQKDAQQAALITRMNADLDTGIEIIVLPTVREPEGLALSSRNAYLSREERSAAICLSRALRAAHDLHLGGDRDPIRLRKAITDVLASEPLARPDYAEVVDPVRFTVPGRLAVLAVRIGRTRLIDNHRLGEPFDGGLKPARRSTGEIERWDGLGGCPGLSGARDRGDSSAG